MNKPSTLWSRFLGWFSQLNPLFRFGILFCLIFVPLDVLAITPCMERPISVLLSVYAQVTSWVLALCGQNSHVADSTITSPLASISVFRGCDAIDSILVLCAGVVAYPTSWKNKLLGLLLGVPALFIMNVVRILSLYAIRIKAPAFFEPAHLQIWPVVFVIAAGLLWLAWVRWALRKERTRDVAA